MDTEHPTLIDDPLVRALTESLARALEPLSAQLSEIKTLMEPRLPRPRRETGEETKEPLTEDEQRRVLEACLHYFDGPKGAVKPGANSDLTNERIYQTIWVMIWAGLHRGVVANPVKKRLRFEEGILRFRRMKKIGTKADSAIPIRSNRIDMVAEWAGWLRARGGIHYKLLNRIFHQLGVDAKLDDTFAPLSARHTAGARMAQSGKTAYEIADRLNCSLSVARVYCRKNPKIGDMDDVPEPGEMGLVSQTPA